MGVVDEYLKSYYCCMLYALDYHSEAEKMLNSFKNTEMIASNLSTNLKSWLKTLGHSKYRIQRKHCGSQQT